MMKNIRFYTIAVLFCKLPTPKVNRCLHMDIRHLISESHAISCLPEFMGQCRLYFRGETMHVR